MVLTPATALNVPPLLLSCTGSPFTNTFADVTTFAMEKDILPADGAVNLARYQPYPF